MKKLQILATSAFLGFSLASCSVGGVGPQGPAGYDGSDGFDGEDGGLVYASAIELIVDFTPANDFLIEEAYGFEVFPADVPLVYIKWDELDNGTELWRPVPQSAYLEQGILTYNFDFTTEDFSLFLDGTVADFATVDGAYLNEQVFRVVVVPAAFLETGRIGSLSYENATKTFNVSESDFVKRDLR